MSRTRVYIAMVCGSRAGWTDASAIEAAIATLVEQEPYLLVVTGGAAGVDTLADAFARQYGAHTAIVRPLWDKGKQAGVVRNRVMLDLFPDLVLAFRAFGVSDGTDDSVREARRRGIYVTLFHADGRIEKFEPPLQGVLGADA